MTKPIVDPPVPFLGPIDGGLDEGCMVRIQGFAPPDGQRFNINFQTGPSTSPRDNVALHLSVRLTEGYIARNSLENGQWGSEQGDGQLPVGLGERFEIIILCGSSDFKVAVNGKHFCEFPQRIPASRVSHLAIEGTLVLSLISVEGNELSSKSVGAQQGGMYGSPQSAGGEYGPPQSAGGEYGPPGSGYGPPPNQYGPPPGQYGPQQGGYGQYGPAQGGYGPPGAPPGHQPESGLESFLDQAGSVIAGAISSGMADKLIGSLTGGGANQQGVSPEETHNQPQQQQPQYSNPQQQQPQQQPSFGLPQLGGQGSLGGLGSVGSLLTSFADQLLQPKKNRPTPPGLMPSKPGIDVPQPSAPPSNDDVIPTMPIATKPPIQGSNPPMPQYPPSPMSIPPYPQSNKQSFNSNNPGYPLSGNPQYGLTNNAGYPTSSNSRYPPYPSTTNPPYPTGSNPGYLPKGNTPYPPASTTSNPPYPPTSIQGYSPPNNHKKPIGNQVGFRPQTNVQYPPRGVHTNYRPPIFPQTNNQTYRPSSYLNNPSNSMVYPPVPQYPSSNQYFPPKNVTYGHQEHPSSLHHRDSHHNPRPLYGDHHHHPNPHHGDPHPISYHSDPHHSNPYYGDSHHSSPQHGGSSLFGSKDSGKNSKLNKAIKYGLPIVGTGVAAYAISRVVGFGSSSSSDSD